MAKRLLALAVAIGLVVAAFAVRDRRDGSASEDGGGSATGRVLVCAKELQPVCEALKPSLGGVEVRVEEVGTTIDALSAASFDTRTFAGWLVPGPLPQLVDDRRERAGLPRLFPADPGVVLARSPLAIAVWGDRAQALEARCGAVTWVCIGDAAGRPWSDAGGQASWGNVKPGHAPADRSAEGLFVFAQAAASKADRPDLASNDLQDGELRLWLTRLERSVPTFTPPAGSPFAQMLFTGPAAFDAVGTLEAEAGPAIASSRYRSTLRLVVPQPTMTADVHFAVPTGQRSDPVRATLGGTAGAKAFAAAGWRVSGQPLADGLDPGLTLPDQSGLPSAGTLDALRSLWIDITR